jgi:hypothetical protein
MRGERSREGEGERGRGEGGEEGEGRITSSLEHMSFLNE